MPDILHRVGISAPAENVFRALSEEKGLAGWWTVNVRAEPKVGSVAQFRFDEHGFNDMKIVELVPNRLVRWKCVDGADEWIGTEVSFDLNEKTKGSTTVLFAQRGWKGPSSSCITAARNGRRICSASKSYVKWARESRTRTTSTLVSDTQQQELELHFDGRIDGHCLGSQSSFAKRQVSISRVSGKWP